MIERVMAAARLRARQLDVVAAAVGPGGFTGIRAGLAAAQGIALAVGARPCGVSSFEAVAAAFVGEPRDDRVLLVVLDSRREDLYVQLFAPTTRMALARPQSVLPQGLADYAGGFAGDSGLLIAGDDAAAAAAAALAGRHAVAIAAGSAPDARGVAAAALHRLKRGEPAPALRPLYLRPPDVTLPRRPAAGGA